MPNVQADPAEHPLSAGEPALLPQIVITGTRTERLLEDVPVRTQVIDRATLERRQARDLADALRLLPGVYLRTIHGKQGQEIWMQGLDGDRVLILIDGIPAIASTGSTVDLTQIMVADVERIEVVRGATSALYGSSAMGGVINVITRRPEATAYRLQAEVGAYDRRGDGDVPHGAHLLGRWSRGGEYVSAEFTGDWRRNDGFSLQPERFAQDVHGIEHLNLSSRLDWNLAPRSRFSLRPTWMQEDKTQRVSVSLPGGAEGRRVKEETVRQPGLVLDLNRATDDRSDWRMTASWSRFENQTSERSVAGDPLTRRDAEIVSRRIEGQWNHEWNRRHWLTLGALARDERLDQTKDNWVGGVVVGSDEIEPGARHRNQEVFAQDNIFFGEKSEILAGLRYQHDSDFGGFLAPSLNLKRQVDSGGGRLNLRAGVGRGYRVPNLKERYFEFDQSSLGYRVAGNPDLQPESSVSVQIGAEWLPLNSRAPRWDVNLFHNDIRDLITTEFNTDLTEQEGLQVFDYRNLARARTWGVETGLAWQISRDLRWDLGYTWLQAEDQDTGRTLPLRPAHQVKTELIHQRGRLQLSAGAEYQSSEFIDSANTDKSPAWTRVNLRGAWRHGPVTWLAGVDNVFDQVPAAGDAADFSPKPGRYVYLGLRLDGPFGSQ
ncbi:TonB-dependent receptor [Thioalkalivibrio nitratireducens DSM 14787]|uniref:TonB-dependent receptor n=1 Tax=Thioalkalivibrio nitratireducens (strain DSM 14787 / UNIQEM 213 / ALEN2) TaxID=1255043 RepID=L0DTG3_THIND|nr:TonB-dependent receptor [Thioalkalivibrio nitratireducens DSM 14787]